MPCPCVLRTSVGELARLCMVGVAFAEWLHVIVSHVLQLRLLADNMGHSRPVVFDRINRFLILFFAGRLTRHTSFENRAGIAFHIWGASGRLNCNDLGLLPLL